MTTQIVSPGAGVLAGCRRVEGMSTSKVDGASPGLLHSCQIRSEGGQRPFVILLLGCVMTDLDLRICRVEDNFVCSVEASDVIGESVAAPLSAADVQGVSKAGRDLLRDLGAPFERVVEFGKKLFATLVPEPVREAFVEGLRLARRSESPVTLRLVFDYDPELHGVPWEAMHDGRAFLALDSRVRMHRHIRQHRAVRTLQLAPKSSVLATFSDRGDPPLDLAAERETVREALRARMTLHVLDNPDSEAIVHQFRRSTGREMAHPGQGFVVWHHAGHGQVEEGPGASGFRLVLRNSDGAPLVITDLMEELSTLQLAVFNCCHGGHAKGLATALARINLPAVVGHQSAIADAAANIFAEEFYRNLFSHSPAEAMRRARVGVLAAGHGRDWLLPVLFMRVRRTEAEDL